MVLMVILCIPFISEICEAVDLINAKGKAMGFAISIAYPSKDIIGPLLAKASSHGNALNKLQNKSS